MKDKFIKSILKVVEDVFSTMVSLEPKPEKHYKSDGKISNCRISGIMGLAGKINASIVLHFEEQVALKATSNMLGADYSKIDGDVKDAVGELTNMVAGGVKVEFDNSGMDLNLSLPIVVSGDEFSTENLEGQEAILIPFVTEDGKFFVEFSFKENIKN